MSQTASTKCRTAPLSSVRVGLVLGVVALASLLLGASSAVASTPQPYFNGFESDTSGWISPTRVPSGTDGITSATGDYNAEDAQNAGDFTRWGGYTDTFPGGGYTTSVDIYLDVNCPANDTRFDWDSAISDSAGHFRRDFVFNAGCYTAPSDHFTISASNNAGRSGADPTNPGRDPIDIGTSGWYTFQHRFYDNGGVLASDMSIRDSSGNLVHSWTLSDPTDLIPSVVGGNRYGWFASNEFPFLAVDNTTLAVDVQPPETQIDSGPSGRTNNPSPTFTFSSPDPDTDHFQCRLDSTDAADWQTCTSPKGYLNLVDGPHTFQVRAIDSSGNPDPTPASSSFTVNPQEPTITASPRRYTNQTDATFVFHSTDPSVTFKCRLVDETSLKPCDSGQSYGGLAEGAHTFRVRALDAYGTLSAPADYKWIIDTTAPAVQIDSGPSGTVNDPAATFGFSSDDPSARFRCRLDGPTGESCSSPKAYSDLASGSHRFAVRALDPAGNASTWAVRNWTVAP